MYVLAHSYLLVILLWSSYVDSLLFYKSWHNDVHNCSNTCLYAVWSTLILILIQSISFFSWFVFDEFIDKGESMSTKLVELFANRMVKSRNMINDYLRRRACIESVRGSWFWAFVLILSFSCSSELFLTLICYFAWFCRFSCLLLALTIFLLLDDLLEHFLYFWVF
jgi:hypothetical protein